MKSSQSNADGPVAVFDSGVGGVSVLRELIKIMPGENYLYFGDSINAPYGMKDRDEVRELTCAHAAELFGRGAKGLVVACNTATSAAVRVLREMYPEVPIVGIEPAVKPAVLSGDHPRVLVMATPMTIREEKFKSLMERYEDQGEIIPLPCPGLMDFIERGDLDGDDLLRYLTELLCDFSGGKVDAAVLGCTHYPFARRQIQSILGENVKIFDGGEGTAREMRRRLSEAGLLRPDAADGSGSVIFENSADDGGKIAICKRLLEM